MTKTKLEKLNLLDRFLFDEAMEDKETCQAMISILLENEVELLEKPETEKEFRVSPELREVRLDVVECPDLRLDDGAVRVFINTKGTNREAFSQEFLDFMEYLSNTTDEEAEHTGSRKIKRIHERICQIRKSEKAGVKYMQRWEELAYAKEDGEQCKLIKQVCKKLAKHKTPEVIAEELEEDIEEILPICKVAKKFSPEYDSGEVCREFFSELGIDWD